MNIIDAIFTIGITGFIPFFYKDRRRKSASRPRKIKPNSSGRTHSRMGERFQVEVAQVEPRDIG